MRPRLITVEGVPYRRFVVRYRLRDGRRRRIVRYSPGLPWVREEVTRELLARHGADAVAPGSCTIREAS